MTCVCRLESWHSSCPGAKSAAWAADLDGDGWDTTSSPEDCDDTDQAVNPGAEERTDNGVDDDCDGSSELKVVSGSSIWTYPLAAGDNEAHVSGVLPGDVLNQVRAQCGSGSLVVYLHNGDTGMASAYCRAFDERLPDKRGSALDWVKDAADNDILIVGFRVVPGAPHGVVNWTWNRLPIDTPRGKLQQPWSNELGWGTQEPRGDMVRRYQAAAIGGMWEGELAW